jgi:hypothetical protein
VRASSSGGGGGATSATAETPRSIQRRRKKLYSFEEARRIARGHGFANRQEFLEYECPGAYQLPKDPDDVWRDEWRGWDDWLGVPWTWEEGRALVRKRLFAGAATREAYEDLLRKDSSVRFDPDLSRLPHRPDLYYKNDGWKGWDDWLGIGIDE